jgi:hypothetical protein
MMARRPPSGEDRAMKARKTKRTRAKAAAKAKDLPARRSARVKGGIWDARTQQTRQVTLVQDL